MNFIEKQQRVAGKKFYPVMQFSNPKNEIEHEQFKIVKPIIQKAFDSWFLNAGRKGIDDITAQTITNTIQHILESGLLEEKPVSRVEYLPEDGHNTLARDIKEFISNMDKV